jgi:hypothetical protein
MRLTVKAPVAIQKYHQEQLLSTLQNYKRDLAKITGESYAAFLDIWMAEVKNNEAKSKQFRYWLENQIRYYESKEPVYTNYLTSLLKSSS